MAVAKFVMQSFVHFPVLENAIIKVQDFPGFPRPVRTLFVKGDLRMLTFLPRSHHPVHFQSVITCKYFQGCNLLDT